MQTIWKRLTCALLAVGVALASGAALAQPVPRRFTIAVIPDTQNYADFTHQRAASFPFDARDLMTEQLQFIADQAASRGGDIVFATAVGDVWQHPVLAIDPDHAARGFRPRPMSGGDNLVKMAEGVRTVEIPAAIAAYDLIDGVLPFSVVSGNHDYDGQWWDEQWPQDLTAPAGDLRRLGMIHIGGLTAWNQAFGADTKFFKDRPWYVASHDGGADSAQVFEAGGYRFLHIGLQMAPSDASLTWAETVIHAHPGLPTLITTHDFIDKTGKRRAHPVVDLHALDPYDNDAQGVWDKLIARNPQIFMVLSGHHNGQAFRTDLNRQGGAVYQLLSDYQDRNQTGRDAGLTPDRAPGIGDGWMRLMAFDMTGETPTVRVRAYSTHYRQYASDQPEYAQRYKPNEQPQMSDADFVASDDFVIRLEDFRARFGPGAAGGSAGQ
ncbi:serine/threonine protein phosphatase [Brevundimonas fontaquae]|uniref:Serine/threonine protein phosphatase n=1 Tax=Brevundimonas fontaquae TaxID=2813778 RepID=A0ABX7LZ24_9CAUL|nr:serine/threonine protein phosphatase [Brevundimonas fontaquae]QSF55708.1 serine/threonine protein phosphatase [Brevundimonas fontaquae]